MSLTSYSTSVTATLPPTTLQPSTISTILETSATSTFPSLTSIVSPMSSASSGTSSSVVPTTAASSSVPPSTATSSPTLNTSPTPSLTSMSSGTVSPTTASSQSPTSASTSTITQATSSSLITSQSSISTTTPTSSSQTTPSQTLTTSSSATTTSSSSTTTSLAPTTTSSSPTTTSSSPQTTSSSPTTTSSPPTTTSFSTTTSPVPTPTTSTIRTTTSSPSPTSSSSTSAPPSPPSSTSSSLVPVVTTLESTIFITTTNSAGQPTTTAPSIVTEVTTSTNAAGAATTITIGVANPTLEPNNGSSSNSTSTFFSNTGAVVGVFVVVGLAAASIVLWIFFYIRRKSRIRRIDRDTEVEAAVAAAGFGRTLLDDDAPRSPPHSGSQYSTQMAQRNIPSYVPVGLGQSVSGPLLDDDNVAFNPYAGYAIESRPSAVGGRYTRARTASPPPGAERQGPSGSGTDDMGDSSRERKSSYGHTPTYSVGSYEPLLAAYTQGTSADPGANSPPTPPPRNPQRILDASPEHRANVNSLPGYSSDGSADARLDPEIRRRTRSDSLGSDDLRDDEDYSRPMLTVRNMPDSRSTHSAL